MTLATAPQTLNASILIYLKLHTCHSTHGVESTTVSQTKE